MNVVHNGFAIRIWVDNDTSHARMLRGEAGPERLYVDVESDKRNPRQKPRSRRLAEWQVGRLGLYGNPQEQLVAAAKWWIDAPDEFERATEIGAELDRHRKSQQIREQKTP